MTYDTLKLHLKVWVIIASYHNLIWVMIGNRMFSALVLLCNHNFNIISTSDFNTKLTAAMEHVMHALSDHRQIVTSHQPLLIHVKYVSMILKITIKSCKHFVVQISKKEVITSPFNVTISAATSLHCLAMTLLSKSQNLQKVGNGYVIFNGNVLGLV